MGFGYVVKSAMIGARIELRKLKKIGRNPGIN